HLESGRAYGVLVDHTGKVEMDIGKSYEGRVSITVEGESLVVYFFAGPTPEAVLRQYSELTGRMPLPARWTLGHHQCRWSYMSEQDVMQLATRLRERHHPCDAVWLDIDYMDGYRNFTWNPTTFPDPASLTQRLHAMGLRLVTILDPGTKVDEEYSIYREGMQKDYFCRYPDGEVFVGEVWPGASVFPDFSRAEVRSWWGNLYSKLLNVGVDAIWNDMNEPALSDFLTRDPQTESAIQSEAHKTMALTVMHRAGGDQPTGPDGPAVSHRFFHNAYGMEMARATYEGLSRLLPGTRPFVLTRSGTAGVQRYAAVWTGDNDSTWEHLRLGIRMCLNLGMSGVPFVGVDIGGFWGTCDGELLVRFAQLGALLPFSRNHNALGNPDQEPWAFGEPYESAYRKAIELRYRLLPYLYTLFHQSSLDGSPIMRPLYYHFPQDELAHETQDEFLLGAALLSAPVSEPGAVSRSVYLPAGTWIDYWDGSEYPGEATIELAAPLDRWPLLVPGNSILPSGPLMQYTDERPTDPLTFSCYMTSDGQASFTLYEDDGNSQAYRSGAFALTTVSCRVENDLVTVRIDEQQNNYQPQRESYEINVYVGGRRLHRNVEAGRGSVTVRFA
ncbi:MAG: DUF5110 domain-containing protein, partial [Ktedonobacteraceae bacterium]|nr:DUF5110 domain-containing protein [Ktedonobacteraceae bacterium]